MRTMLIVAFLVPALCFADEIRFKNFAVVSNVVVVDTTTVAGVAAITVVGKDFRKQYRLDNVVSIVKSEVDFKYNPQADVEAVQAEASVLKTESHTTTRPIFILPALLSGVASWYWFDAASSTTDAIDAANKLNQSISQFTATRIDVASMESQRTRYYIFAGVAAAVGIGLTVYALTPIEVTANPQSITVSYKL